MKTMDERLIVQIICDKEAGTAFYVAPSLLLTAYHTVSSFQEKGNNIIKDTVYGDLRFEVLKNYTEEDVSVLKVLGQRSSGYLPLLSHHLRIKEECESFGYPDTKKNESLRIEGRIIQKDINSTADFRIHVKDMSDDFDYDGMSGAPVCHNDSVVGIVIEQSGTNINIVSVEKIEKKLEEFIAIDHETGLEVIPEAIAKNVEVSRPNYTVFDSMDEKLASQSSWLLLYGRPGSGKTTISAGYEPEDKAIEIIGRFFFKVPNDTRSRAERCSEGFFLDWLELVYINKTGTELGLMSLAEKKKSVSRWLYSISSALLQEGKKGIIILDGLDELVAENGNRVDDILSLLPETLPDNIKVVLSCITDEILPSSVIEKISQESRIEVSPLNMADCEFYIRDNSGDWEKPYSFIQAVAQKTEGHPLYMNYLCRYISESFDATTKEEQLNEWVDSLPSIGGDIRSYYEAVWKKANPDKTATEILALLSQTRGPVAEPMLIGMMKSRDPYEFISSTKEFSHLLKEPDTDNYEIYHSSFRLFVTDKLSSIISYANDQIASFCDANKELIYSVENALHHFVNGSDVEKGLSMCNQEWADTCALNDVSPDLVMHDIKECLSIAVDHAMSVEVIRLMLLAQRIETRCDAIMVDNVYDFADLKIAMGKPGVALKYLVRDNVLLINELDATTFLRTLFWLGYDEQALKLSDAIEASIRNDFANHSKGVSTYTLMAKGFSIVERMAAGVESSSSLHHFFNFLAKMITSSEKESADAFKYVQDVVVSYLASHRVRSGVNIDIEEYLESLQTGWREDIVRVFIDALSLYEGNEKPYLRVGYNEAYYDCLRQVENALQTHSFNFSKEDLGDILHIMLYKSDKVELVEKLLADYAPNPGNLMFRDANGVDFDAKALKAFYRECLYEAYSHKIMSCPAVNRNYYGDSGWEKYVETLIRRVAYLAGQLYRKRGLGENIDECYALVKETIDSIDFSFEIRVRWKRAYLLPEELFPFIYEELLGIYCDFFESKLSDFMEHLKRRMPDQLCIYREGYCTTLIKLIGVFNSYQNMHDRALFLMDEAMKYVLYAVQNRRERCYYLTTLCRESAVMGERDKANEIYQEVLNSSMGPDWYKEAQLGLIEVLNETGEKLNAEQVAHLAAIFEEASGEMTFQRYVKQEKNEFVASIARISSLQDAIAYYKFETFPSPEQIIKNAEDWKVDMPVKGDGYDLGANHLSEASALCSLLQECKTVSPYIRYAFSELFWENWDKMHNDDSYAQLHADIILEIGEGKAIETLMPRMAEYIAMEYYRDKKGSYLKDLGKKAIPPKVIESLEKNLSDCGFAWHSSEEEPAKYEHEETIEEMLAPMPDCKSALNRMRKDVVSPLGSYWYSLNQFIKPLIKKPDFDKTKLFDVISGHYDMNVRPSTEQFDKFSWFKGAHEEKDVNEQMIHFLIWFMVHPDYKIVERTKRGLLWLVNYDKSVVDCLISEIINPSEIGLATESSEMLLEISQSNPYVVLEYIIQGETQKQLCDVPIFSVSRNLYEIALILTDKCGYNDLLQVEQQHIPETLPNRGDVVFENKDMMFVEHKIDKLNGLQVTGGKEFAKPYIEKVRALQNDGSIKKLNDSDRYSRRSFYLDYLHKGRYGRTMEDILNRVLYGKVDYKRASRVYYAIND